MEKTNTQTCADISIRAMDKVRDEMAAKPDDNGVQAVGAMLTQLLSAGMPGLDVAILAADKSVAGAFDALYKHASKNQKGHTFFADTSVAMKVIVNGYFGVDAVTAVPVVQLAKPARPADDLFAL